MRDTALGFSISIALSVGVVILGIPLGGEHDVPSPPMHAAVRQSNPRGVQMLMFTSKWS